jgi:hypothetical protein
MNHIWIAVPMLFIIEFGGLSKVGFAADRPSISTMEPRPYGCSLEVPRPYADCPPDQLEPPGPPILKYFLDTAPTSLSVSTLPKTAKQVVVAKVRMTSETQLRFKTDETGAALPDTPGQFESVLEIVDIVHGKLNEKSQITVTYEYPMGKTLRRSFQPYPSTPQQRDRDYFVVIYSDDRGKLRLAAFPMSDAEYDAWEAELPRFHWHNDR